MLKRVKSCSNLWRPELGDKDTRFAIVNTASIAYIEPMSPETVKVHFVGGPAPMLCVARLEDFLEITKCEKSLNTK